MAPRTQGHRRPFRASSAWRGLLANPWLLILPLVLFMVTLVAAIHHLVEREQRGFLTAKNDSFVLFATGREINRFLDLLRGYVTQEEAVALDDMLWRFEILASRAPLFREGEVGHRLSEFPGIPAWGAAFAAALNAVEPALGKLPREPRHPDYLSIRATLRELEDELFGLSTSFLARAEARKEAIIRDVDGSTGQWYLAAFGASATLLLVLYVFHLRRSLRTSAALARESEELRRAKVELSYRASHDPLTGLINRAEFERRLQALCQHPRSAGGALLYMDLDRFKRVNDSCGHLAGDELLRQVAALLASRVRKGDTLARLGGDEFALLLETCTVAEAGAVAEHILQDVQAFRFAWQGHSFDVGVSIGVAPLAAGHGQPDQVLMAADAACYGAKNAGRNAIHVFEAWSVRPGHSHVPWAG